MAVSTVDILKSTVRKWSDDNASSLAASLALYSLLSMAPLIVLAIAIAGFVFGDSAARGQIASELGSVVGPQASQAIESLVRNARAPASNIVSSAVGIAVLLAGASGVFVELQNALNKIWQVQPKTRRGFVDFVRERFFSFTMVLGVAFLLLVSMLLNAALSAAGTFFANRLPGGEALWHAINFSISLGIITALFGTIFKVVPDVDVSWRRVWVGAFGTALLFNFGELLLGLYLGKSSVTSSYGAAGSLAALIVWVYYSAQILFLGAEFTQVYTRGCGVPVRPSANAVPLRDGAAGQKPGSGSRST